LSAGCAEVALLIKVVWWQHSGGSSTLPVNKQRALQLSLVFVCKGTSKHWCKLVRSSLLNNVPVGLLLPL
jgi:hypothetical protein